MENEVKTTEGQIDADVLAVMKDEDITKAISNDTEIKRVVLNCACEMLSEIKNLNTALNEFMQVVSICSADKLQGFFDELTTNVAKEETRQNVKRKVAQSHKKAKK